MKSDVGTVLVTGGASGLGAAVACAVAAADGCPVVLDRREPPAGFEHEIVDLADTEATEAAVTATTTPRRDTPPARGPPPRRAG